MFAVLVSVEVIVTEALIVGGETGFALRCCNLKLEALFRVVAVLVFVFVTLDISTGSLIA